MNSLIKSCLHSLIITASGDSNMASALFAVFLVVNVFIVGIVSYFDKDDFAPPKTSYTTTPETFVVNLDLPPQDRWTHIVTKKPYVDLIPKMSEIFKAYIPDTALILPLLEKFAGDLDSRLKAPYADELRGLSKAMNMSLGEFVIANLLYDVSAFCTSIVMQDDKGVIWHARNLDYSFTELLRNLTIIVDFQRNNKTVYTGVTYAGYIGLMTGQRPKAFTITADERDQGAWWMNLLVFLTQFNDASPVSFLLRDTLDLESDFKSAVQRLAYTVTEAGVYFIVGGVANNEGMVITKGREGPVDMWQLNGNDRWFEVETNYDHFTTPPPSDDRRDPAIKSMNKMGRGNVTVNNLFDVLSTVPVLNNHTTYTVVMSASQPDIMQTWKWHGYV